MIFLRKSLDRASPHFHKGGKLEKLYPVYEALDTFLYTPGEVTHGPSHVRDGMDLKRMMTLVVVSLAPAIAMAFWNTGYQANKALTGKAAEARPLVLPDAQALATRLAALSPSEVRALGVGELAGQTPRQLAEMPLPRLEADADHVGRVAVQAKPDPAEPKKRLVLTPAETASIAAIKEFADLRTLARGEQVGWRGRILAATTGVDPGSFLSNVLHGALWFLPVYLVTVAVGGTWEAIFSIVRKHEINEGFLVTSMLFPLTLPPAIPLWQVATGISFGVVLGKEVFGGTGRNFLNPALVARAYLFFAHSKEITGDKVWNAANAVPAVWDGAAGVDGYTSATTLNTLNSLISVNNADLTHKTLANLSEATGGVTWWKAFLGVIEGSMGETSTLAALLGAAFMLIVGIASWRIMLGCVIGLVGFSSVLYAAALAGWSDNPMWLLPPWWHLVVGGFAFGAVWMATDPVSAAMSRTGMWFYGILIGFVTIVVRSINPAYPEGIMLAILFGNVFAPLIDYFVVQANIKRRLARHAA